VRAVARVHEYLGGRLATFHRQHRLVDYDPARNLCDGGKLGA
jgi:hypothetical protein